MPQSQPDSTLCHAAWSFGLVLLLGSVAGCVSLPIEGRQRAAEGPIYAIEGGFSYDAPSLANNAPREVDSKIR